ncbi:hypothetical protein [Pseudochrobactrum lubricantis]|uniref:hypothetical protein n=1 Tax=Pseudochrobactrum lubricantis TaxID=558172 RepID=UPI0035D5FAE3
MKYDVLREHIGDKFYKSGDVRDAEPMTVAHLVRNGVLRPVADSTTQNHADADFELQGISSADPVILANQQDAGRMDSAIADKAGSDLPVEGSEPGDVSANDTDSEKADKSADLNKSLGAATNNKSK